MDTLMIILTLVPLPALAATWFYLQKKRTDYLRAKFGPEYDRAVEVYGDRTQAEKVLEVREGWEAYWAGYRENSNITR